MFTVEADTGRQLIVLSAGGRVRAAEVKAAAVRVRDLAQDFAPGFQTLTDFRFLDSMEPDAAAHVAEIMDALAARKVARVVRVLPDPHKDIGFNILSRFHYGPQIAITTVETLAEGIAALSVGE